MKITIIGGGNIGTLMAAEMAHKGHCVTIYTSKPEKWNTALDVYDVKENHILTGALSNITNCLKEALLEAQYIWITMPAHLFIKLADEMIPFVQRGQYIGIVPGSGGAEFAFQRLIEKGCILFGFQRVHSISRLKVYGRSVYMLGRKSKLQVASIPADNCAMISNVIEELFDMPCLQLPNYLSVTLTPSNPILHTTRLYSMFKDYHQGKIYPRNPLFYEEWNDDSSELLIACDNELQELCNIIPLDLTAVMSLCEYYESHSATAMTNKISGIPAFKGLISPMVKNENGWIPDFTSRYFTADYSYGLKVIRDIALLFEQDIPNIKTVWNWYEEHSAANALKAFSLKIQKEDFVHIYR